MMDEMRAAIVSIGDELVLGQSLDTNSAWISDALVCTGCIVDEHRTVADDRCAIGSAITELTQSHGLLIITGGLGPTIDDMTREALTDVATPKQPMVQDADALRWLDDWFKHRGRAMPESNLRQSYRPATMQCIPNPHGTAPGLFGVIRDCHIFALPGPPPEMKPMFRNHVAPHIEALLPKQRDAIVTEKVNLYGIGESLAAEYITEMMARDRSPVVGITVSGAIISARIRATGERSVVQRLVSDDAETIEQRWHPYAFGRNDESLAAALGKQLQERGATVATAESCTGGWLGKAIVDVAGSSAYYLGGWVTYSNEMKTQQLGVNPSLIDRHGAVSAEVAHAMAAGAQSRSGADYAMAITGVAGPGGSPEKPAGLVYIALARPGRSTATRRFEFTGDRTAVRERSVLAALQMLRFALLEVGDDVPLLWEVRER